MTDRKLMQQALEALLTCTWSKQTDAAIAALRERLAQHEALDKLVAIDQELGMFEQPVQEPPQFPTMLRKMWSGAEVQQWINENWTPAQPAQEPEYRTKHLRYDLSPAMIEGEIRSKLIELGWTPPGQQPMQEQDMIWRFRTNWRGKIILQVGRKEPSLDRSPREYIVVWVDAKTEDLEHYYTTPQPRQWVGLTEEEVLDALRDEFADARWPGTALNAARIIEQALREKNA